MSGRGAAVPVLGLPGNPVAPVVTALLFARPLLTRLAGLPDAPPAWRAARLAVALGANDQRADHLRCTLATDADGVTHATPFSQQSSGSNRLLADADALLLRPPHAPPAAIGDLVPILRLAPDGV